MKNTTPLLSGLTILISLAMTVGNCMANDNCGCSDRDKTTSDATFNAADTNIMCPVMPDVEVEDHWTTVYRGKVVRFCCNNCVESFRREPEKYVANLPQFQDLTSTSAAFQGGPQQATTVWIGRLLLLLGGFAACYFVLGFSQKRLLRGNSRCSFIVPLIVAGAFAITLTWCLRMYQANEHLKLEVVKQKASSEIHLATYYDYGVPPVPNNPQLQPKLSRSFYRGNDERSPVLFNGGNYQTAQFDLEIQHADGTPVRIGDELTRETLFLKYTIYKPENAPRRMYDQKLMGRMFLTRRYEPTMGWDQPIVDKTPLEVVTKDEVWSCRFPLDIAKAGQLTRFNPRTVTQEKLAAVPGVGPQVANWFVSYRDAGYPIVGPEDLRQAGITGAPARIISASLKQSTHDGIVYVCEAFFHDKRQLGARFHYGINYNVKIRNGRVAEGSEIWMGALSRSLKAKKGAIPDNQWLSCKPLPQIPAPQDINDKLLGIDDYDFQ